MANKDQHLTTFVNDLQIQIRYTDRSGAFRAEMALKHGKRSVARCHWNTADSPWCRGLGAADPRIPEINEALRLLRENYDASKLAK